MLSDDYKILCSNFHIGVHTEILMGMVSNPGSHCESYVFLVHIVYVFSVVRQVPREAGEHRQTGSEDQRCGRWQPRMTPRGCEPSCALL